MEVAKLLAGYSLGEADLLRRAMGKKIKAEMDAQRDALRRRARPSAGISERSANTIFDLLAKFADYGFNKSHAAAYALIAYQTAYLKANHPVEFLAASMTLDLDNTDKLAEFRREAQRIGIAVEPPSINRSGVVFEVERTGEGTGAIRYALAAIKGVGRGRRRIARRGARRRPVPDLADLAQRINPRLLNKRTLESLVAAGALDEIEPDRARAAAARRADDGARAAPAEAESTAARRHVRRRRRGRRRAAHPAVRALAGVGAAAQGIRGGRLLPVGPSARRIRRRS